MNDLSEALGPPKGNYNPVLAAFEGLTERNKEVFREAIHNDAYTHAEIAAAMRRIGYDIDRKQIQAFREKLKLGKVEL